MLWHHMPQEHNIISGQMTLVQVRSQSSGLNPRKYLTETVKVVLKGRTVDLDVIKTWKSPPQQFDPSLKCGRLIIETHWHRPPVVKALASSERSLLSVLLSFIRGRGRQSSIFMLFRQCQCKFSTEKYHYQAKGLQLSSIIQSFNRASTCLSIFPFSSREA